MLKVAVRHNRAVDGGGLFTGEIQQQKESNREDSAKPSRNSLHKSENTPFVSVSFCGYRVCVFTGQRELIRRVLTRGFFREQKLLIALIKDLCDTPESQNNNGGESKTREDA